jgi:dihydrolipoamide dehydrogenase-binding protein of pyruvate dehydrogenase complex
LKVSVNDFIIKAAAIALQRVPEVNVQVNEDNVRYMGDIDISVAVATDAGLITPIVKDAIGQGIEGISNTVKELAQKAKVGKLQPHEFMGGTFTISNLGMFGITEFSAIINPPQSAIMAVGGSRLVLDPDTEQPRSRMTATISFDARAIDDAAACLFLETFQELMENPGLLIAGLPRRAGDGRDLIRDAQ